MGYVEIVKGVVQIIFWIVVSIVTVLTYRQARRTVLQPIRTEVFKAQLKAMSEIMGMFLGKGELALRDDFDFRSLFNANLCYLMDAYASNFFDLEFDQESRPYSFRDCPVKMHVREAVAEPSVGNVAKSKPAEPSVKAARWNLYEIDRLHINRQCCEMEKHLTGLLENPLLPLPLVELLTRYRDAAGQNKIVLWGILNSAAQEMPERFSSLEDLEGMPAASWSRELWSRYMKEFEHFKPLADEIVEFVREYFEADDLKRV